jgi:hypothetical protein
LYKDVSDIDQKFICGAWEFWSPNEIKKRCNVYSGEMIDVAINYLGMGYVMVISYVPDTDMFIFRHDGGSDFEKQEYFKKYSDPAYQPAKFDIYTKNIANGINIDISDISEKYQYSLQAIMNFICPSWQF